ncbi:MAG: tetratricopeptide repeat protein [Bacteroidetes bacterium]|nr:tetratricopeptide repeat protein [Bacteroidota bacterium]
MLRPITMLLIAVCLAAGTQAQTTATEWYNKGLDFSDAGKYDDAITALDKAIALNPNYADAYFSSGWIQNELGNYDKAIIRLQKATQLKKDFAKAYQELGYAYKGKKNYTEAMNNLNRAITIKPDYAMAYKVKGDVLQKLNRYTEAVTAYEKAYELDNTLEGACYELGYYWNSEGDYEKAMEWLHKAIGINPAADSYNELGYAYYSLKRNDEAFNAYNNALKLDPYNGTAYKGIADVYRKNFNPSKTEDAIENYRKALQYNPSSSGSYYGIGWCYNETEQYDSSIVYLKKSLNLDATYNAAYTELGYAQYMKGYNTDALATFDKSLSLDSKQNLPVYYKGLLYADMKDRINATKMYNILKPNDADLAGKLLTRINNIGK